MSMIFMAVEWQCLKLEPSSDIQNNFKVRMLNQVRIEQLENRSDLNDTLRTLPQK